MNAEDKWVELWKKATYEDDGSVGFGPDLDEIKAIGDEMVEHILALRELNHDQFQEIGRLTNIIRRRGNAIREHTRKEGDAKDV